MKKLLSILLVLAMVLSMMGTAVFASEEADDLAEETPIPVEEVIDEEIADEEIADEEIADDEIVDEEIADEEIADEEIADEEIVDETIVAEEDILILDGGDSLSVSTGLADGEAYVIGIENTDGTYTVLQCDSASGKAVATTIDSLDDVDATMIWTAASGYSLECGGYYIDKAGELTTTEKANWKYTTDGYLYYIGGGQYYIIFGSDGLSTQKISSSVEDPSTEGATKGITLWVAPTVDDPTGGYKQANGFVDGQSYIIGAENADGTYTVVTISDDSAATTSLAALGEATEAVLWLATVGDDGALLSNGEKNLYIKDGFLTEDAKNKWTYTDTLYYQGGAGTSLYLAEDGSITSTAATPFIIWTQGETGEATEPEEDSGSSSSIIYNETTDIKAYAYIGIVDDAQGKALSLDMGWHGEAVTIAGETPNRTMEATKGTSASVVSVDGAEGVAITLEDPPGETNYLYVDETGALSTTKDGDAADYANWTYSGTSLCYTANGTTYYVSDLVGQSVSDDASAAQVITLYGGTEAASGGGGGGSDEEEDPEAPVIVKQPDVIPYVYEGSGFAAPEVTVSAQLAEGVVSDTLYFQWYVDGAAYGEATGYAVADYADGIVTDTVTIPELADDMVGTGVYNIYCEVSCNVTTETTDETTGDITTEEVAHSTDSFAVSFIVTSGILENSFLTFSDVHQTYDCVGIAINDVITVHGGFIPALIVCTGDWANGHADYDETLETHIAQLFLQVGNIDMVFVGGNHEDSTAATDASVAADLGFKDYDNDDTANSILAQIYDADYESESVGTSAANTGLKVFSLNFDAVANDYTNVLPELEAFLEDVASDYKGELIVISSHTGLHVLGMGPSDASEWGGGANYNNDNAYLVVEMLNAYAAEYGMDIMFFFGHDHSKGESEFLLVPGETITSVISYTETTYVEIPLNFTYGHAGYIGEEGASGVTDGRYTLVRWDQETIDKLTYILEQTEPDAENTAENIERLAEFPEDPGNEDGQGGSDKPSDAPSGSGVPNTGDDSPIALWAIVMVLCLGAMVAILPRKKHN